MLTLHCEESEQASDVKPLFMSFGQHRLWFHDAFFKNSRFRGAIYRIHMVCGALFVYKMQLMLFSASSDRPFVKVFNLALCWRRIGTAAFRLTSGTAYKIIIRDLLVLLSISIQQQFPYFLQVSWLIF